MAALVSVDAVESLDLPNIVFKKRFGFGVDFGSSIIKIVHTTEEGDNIRIHTSNFSRQNQSEAFQFLQRVTEGKLQPGGTYQLSGVGIGENLGQLESLLNIKCTISSEHLRMVEAIRFLANNLSWEDFVYPDSPQARSRGAENAKIFAELLAGPLPPEYFDTSKYRGDDGDVPGVKEVQYPYIISIVGSGHYLFKIESETRGRFLDFHTVAGRTLLGLGNLLTGCESYAELIDLASKGHCEEVDQSVSKLGASETDDVYASLNTCPVKLFAFGMAAKDKNKDVLKKEDIAAALRSMITNTVAQDAFNWSMTENIHQVFFVGGVVANNEQVRREIETEFMFKNYGNSKDHDCKCYFVKVGGHLPAIGSLLQNIEIL